MKKESEFEVVRAFSHILGLPNKTDGSLFIYKGEKGKSKKPDGYYFYDGITFILDAKAPNEKFTGQLKDYMELESNENFIGFEYNKTEFRCYVNGKLIKDELTLKDKEYYKEKYFPKRISNEQIVNSGALKLANLFRNSKIDKQMNVPFIGAVMLCMKFLESNYIDLTSTATILKSIKQGINEILVDKDIPITKKEKKRFILRILDDSSLNRAKSEDLFTIIQEISTIYNFIHISADDYKGHDIMNNFLKVFRRWNSVNANEKGEVFTPDHIANLMYSLAYCSKDSEILDPTCGSGTFLTNAMANMFNEIDPKLENLHETQKNIKQNRLIGIETNEFNATLAGINMMLHGDGASQIYNADCFERLPSLQNMYNRVLMNPPFAQSDIELKFVYETLYYMRDDGFLATIVPKSCVSGTIEANVRYLSKIFKIANLKAVISLPTNLFYPVGANTCIIVLHKTNIKDNKTILINCLNDGFEVVNKARICKNDEWDIINNEILKAYLENDFAKNRAIIKTDLQANDELLFEAYSSHRNAMIQEEVYTRYIREAVSAKVLCGFELHKNTLKKNAIWDTAFEDFSISDLIIKIGKGREKKSIDRKIENKYPQNGIPLIIAKKDNNGIGGAKLRDEIEQVYSDKICIISGGDGGGGKTYYCEFEFCATNFVMICDFANCIKDKIDKFAKYFLAITISETLFKTIGHGRTISEVPNINIKLPITAKKEIDFAYMSNYIQKIQYAEFL
ncbi:HsdM family class I SAM-dependent methyltransferase [Campylobacter upsaliensis]|uniref:HsdM family class I SAM-dependent methyltransferase n=1 Tax=Campylobacter upsaliensis TaxID=28080 RepID=UPI0022EB12F7|nr:N-6 DNA methylase [Campylobacter upsaliensis]